MTGSVPILVILQAAVSQLREQHRDCEPGVCPWRVMWDEDVKVLHRVLGNAAAGFDDELLHKIGRGDNLDGSELERLLVMWRERETGRDE